jgi:hypothetical protein
VKPGRRHAGRTEEGMIPKWEHNVPQTDLGKHTNMHREGRRTWQKYKLATTHSDAKAVSQTGTHGGTCIDAGLDGTGPVGNGQA